MALDTGIDAVATESPGHRRGGHLLTRLGIMLAFSAALNAAAVVVAVTVTRSAAVAGDSTPWLTVGIVTVLAAAVSFVLLSASVRRIASRLKRVVAVLGEIQQGDLTARVSDTAEDEIGQIARAVDATAAHTRDVVVEVQRAAALMRQGWEELEGIGGAMSNAAEDTSVQALAAAAAADQVSSSIHVVAAATEELVATVREVAVHASEASSVATSAAEQAALANSSVNELGSASQRVGQISALILSIAGQTHLLALNAAIEAARAGDMGRGFAVVAGEVKELARETTEATETVSRTITEIQTSSDRATIAIGEISNTILTVSESQSAIASAVVEQTAATNEIGRVSADAAAGSGQIALNIARVSDAARATAYAGGQARTTAAVLAKLESSLLVLTAHFTLGDVVAAAADDIDENALGTSTVEGMTIVQDYVKGIELNQFDYQGAGWRYSTDNLKTGGSNSYNCTPGEVAVLRFVGTGIRLYGISDASHGMASASIDGGPGSTVDLYSPERASGQVTWASPVLPHGEHRMELRVLDQKNHASRYFWVAIDRVEIY